jgi:hypothetical protein
VLFECIIKRAAKREWRNLPVILWLGKPYNRSAGEEKEVPKGGKKAARGG